MARILVTGSAGFIGYHLCERLLRDGEDVVGLDVVNAYYDVRLKEARLARLARHAGFRNLRLDLARRGDIENVFATERPEVVVHLAAQAGVRHSLTNPHDYLDANLVGFLHILEGCRHGKVAHLLYASSSSVYGLNASLPFSEHDDVSHPLSLYAATKRANEMMAHSYSHLYGLPTSGLRFFTAYGPWGRPDMALFKFTEAMVAGRPVDLFNFGQMRRDFTYVDDVVEAIARLVPCVPAPDPAFDPSIPDPATSSAPWRIYNVGNSDPVDLEVLLAAIEVALGRKAERNALPMQPGDVRATAASTDLLWRTIGWKPSTPIDEGVRRFVVWYREWVGT